MLVQIRLRSESYLIKWSRIRLIVDLFGCGRSLKMTWRDSILAASLEFVNWLNVSKNWKENFHVENKSNGSQKHFQLPFGNDDLWTALLAALLSTISSFLSLSECQLPSGVVLLRKHLEEFTRFKINLLRGWRRATHLTRMISWAFEGPMHFHWLDKFRLRSYHVARPRGPMRWWWKGYHAFLAWEIIEN